MKESADESLSIVAILILLAMFWAVDNRYEPDSLAGYAVGYFILPGDLITGENHHSRAMAEIEPLLD